MKDLMAQQSYNVPIVPPDLRREETIHQICDSLLYVDQVANDIFNKISARVAENHTRLKAINERVDLAQARIEKIKGSNKATKVFAGSKYPAVEEEDYYKSVYSQSNGLRSPKKTSYKVQGKHPQVDDKVLKEKLQFYNVQIGGTRKPQEIEDQEEGLGILPKKIQSVGSLLLFNTSENPYKKYVTLDPLGVVTKTRAAVEEGNVGPEEAPQTIIGREDLVRPTKEQYFYTPDIGQVPEIAVPDFLPDLLGVADDLLYSADQGPSIAPSVPGSNMPDLPAVVPEIDIPSGPATTGSSNDQPPPPPPPPPPEATELQQPPPPPPPPANIPPPPPPPPPPPIDTDSVPTPKPPPPPAVASSNDNGAAPTPSTTESGGDVARNSLLASIRAAGGAGKAKLRNARNRKIESKKKKQEEQQTKGGGGDLMGDLALKLSMRRKGISGTGKPGDGNEGGGSSASTGGGSAMDRVSAMIPAPSDKKQEVNNDDGEWE